MSTTDDETEPKTGAQGDGSANTPTPFTPSDDDDSAVGSTDQHSKANHHEDPAQEIKRAGASSD